HAVDKKCGDWLEGVVRGLRAKRPSFCLLAGDLAEHGTAAQLALVRDVFKRLAAPVHVVCGNHDWVNNANRQPYEELFPRGLNYQCEPAGWLFVGLDTSQGVRSRVAVQPATLRWLDDSLPKLDRKKPLVVFTHFPLGQKVPNRLANADAVLERFKG